MVHTKKAQPLILLVSLASILAGCGSSSSISNKNSNSGISSTAQINSTANSASSLASNTTDSDVNSSATSSTPLNANNYRVATFASAAALSGDGLTIDRDGNIYLGTSKRHSVNKITPNGEISVFATFESGSANGSDFDSQGNLFVANESAGIIHKITPSGEVSDYLTGINGPAGIYIDDQDNLIVGLYGVSISEPGSEVLKITPDKSITSFASGNGLTNVVGVTGDDQGRYFAANFITGEVFEISDGIVRQIGAAETRVNHMKYFNGYIYTPNPFNNVVRRMDLNGNFELLAGTESVTGSVNGAGESATFSRPNSIDISIDGKTIYVLDFTTGDVRSISIE